MSISRILFVAFAAWAFAQLPATAQTDTGTDDQTSDETTETAAPQVEPEPYVKVTHGDWDVRCIPAQGDGPDPCQIFQLLRTASGNPVAEMTVFPLEDDGPAVAGSTIVVPLETLLTEGLSLSIDGGPVKRYPFTFCQPQGCVARVGFTEDDMGALRRGAKGQLRLVPLSAPDQEALIEISLTGFTAGFAELAEN